MGTVFKFKQFEVDQRDCAMKINTDGVLLGAMVAVDGGECILDIGTGTGVIAMMLAQRASEAQVDAVEIDELAYTRATQNFNASSFAARLVAYFGSYESLDGSNSYDLIVSNPPFYTNSLHNPDDRKKLAKHTDHDFFDKLISFADRNLRDNGRLALIIPVELADYIIAVAKSKDITLEKEISIRSFVDTEVIRKLITLKKSTVHKIEERDFVIYEEKGVYSEAYKSVLKPFFLAF